MHDALKVSSRLLILISLISLLHRVDLNAQAPVYSTADTLLNKKRLNTVIIGGSALYATGMYGFYQLWYKDFETTSFHLFNDNSEWLLMDKIGHVGTSYQLSKWGQKIFIWTGLPVRKSAWYGVGVSTLFQTSIEVFDGFSAEWGFSIGDILANTAGSAMFLAQELAWEEQRITYKYSYHQTDFPKYRPSLLGENEFEKLIKDYNGQTIWLSANIKSFALKNTNLPDWLNVAFGYGASGMITAKENDPVIQDLMLPEFKRYSQFYFSPDIALTKIKTNSKTVKTIFDILEFVKIPMPAIEFNSNGDVKLHPLYF